MTRSSWRIRSGSAMASTAVMRCPLVVKARTTRGRPPGIQTAAAAPSRRAALTARARWRKAATGSAPRVSLAAPS
jgi:hypothetical protein